MRWRDVRAGKIVEKKQKSKPLEFVIAPIFDRFKAFVIDSFMLLMPLMYLVFYVILGSRESFAAHMLLGWIYIFVPHFCIVLAFWYFKAQTPGYKAQKLKIVASNLEKPSLGQLTLRYVLFFVSVLLPAGLVFCFIRADKKNMHDILSSTMPIVLKE